MTTLSIQQVPLQYVNQLWATVEPFIADAFEHAQGDYDVRDAQNYVTGGMWALIVGVDADNHVHGAAVVSFFNRPAHRVAFVHGIGGNLVVNDDNWVQFEAIMQSNGATYLECAARQSAARLWSRYGMESKYTILGKSL
jgi:hypothetical protein